MLSFSLLDACRIVLWLCFVVFSFPVAVTTGIIVLLVRDRILNILFANVTGREASQTPFPFFEKFSLLETKTVWNIRCAFHGCLPFNTRM